MDCGWARWALWFSEHTPPSTWLVAFVPQAVNTDELGDGAARAATTRSVFSHDDTCIWLKNQSARYQDFRVAEHKNIYTNVHPTFCVSAAKCS